MLNLRTDLQISNDIWNQEKEIQTYKTENNITENLNKEYQNYFSYVVDTDLDNEKSYFFPYIQLKDKEEYINLNALKIIKENISRNFTELSKIITDVELNRILEWTENLLEYNNNFKIITQNIEIIQNNGKSKKGFFNKKLEKDTNLKTLKGIAVKFGDITDDFRNLAFKKDSFIDEFPKEVSFRVDHGDNISDILSTVILEKTDEEILFTTEIDLNHDSFQGMNNINDVLKQVGVSVGVKIGEFEPAEEDGLPNFAKDVEIRELSLVVEPALNNSKIHEILKNKNKDYEKIQYNNENTITNLKKEIQYKDTMIAELTKEVCEYQQKQKKEILEKSFLGGQINKAQLERLNVKTLKEIKEYLEISDLNTLNDISVNVKLNQDNNSTQITEKITELKNAHPVLVKGMSDKQLTEYVKQNQTS